MFNGFEGFFVNELAGVVASRNAIRKITGWFVGASLVGSVIQPFLYVFVLAGSAFSRAKITKKNLPIILICILLLAWVLIKSALISNLNKGIVYSLFQVLVILYYQIRPVSREFYIGMTAPVFLFFSVDLFFNIFGLIFGVDPLGQAASVRPGEQFARHGGVMGHPFASVVISMTTLLLCTSVGRYKWIAPLALLNLFATGTYRSVVYVALYFFYIRYLHGIRWYYQCLLAGVAGLLVMSATWVSVLIGFAQEGSGNYFRLFAWANAVSVIYENPILGYWGVFEPFDREMGVSAENIVASGITESAVLADAVFWGLPYVCLKIALILLLARSVGQNVNHLCVGKGDTINWVAIKFVPFVIITDYIMGSAWGSVLFCTVSSIALSLMSGVGRRNIKDGGAPL